MGIKKMKVIFGFPEKRRCCQCKSHMVATLYHNRWYCDTWFQKKQLCFICGENPVEVTKGDNGYCKKCYENSVNTGFTRSVAVLAFCGSLILLDQDQIAGDSVGHLCNDRFNCCYGGNRFFAKEIRPPDQRKAVKSIWKHKNDAVTAAVAEGSAAVNTEKIVPEKWNRKHASMKASG